MKRYVPLAEATVRGDEPTFGSVECTWQLPGGAYRVVGLSPEQALALEPRFGAWRADVQADVVVEVRRAPAELFVLRDVAGEVSSLERTFAADQVQLAGFDLLARMERDGLATQLWTPVDGFLDASTPDPRFLDTFENLLRVLTAYRCLAMGGALFHSSGVVTDRGVHLFVGPSGAGKTTVARLSLDCGFGVLSDDINLVLPDDSSSEGSYRAQRLPFAGELGHELPTRRDDGGTVVGIHRLVQSSDHALREPRGGEALAALLGSCPFVNSDPYVLDRLLNVLEPLRPMADELRFAPDSGFWPLLEASAPQGVLV